MKPGVSVIKPTALLPAFVATREQACADVDPDVFFPDRYTIESTAEAKRICRTCVFLQECGVWAIRTGISDGVWGSLTPYERREIRNDLGLNK